MEHEKSLQFMQIAMKYIPDAKQTLDELGIELSFDHFQPMLDLLTKVMADAYQLGVEEAEQKTKI